MSKYCASCGNVNDDNALNCVTCGAEFEKPAAPVYPQNQGYNPPPQPQPYAQPYAQPQAYNVPMSPPYAPPTSVGGWIGWLILCSLFPVIGQLIMLTSKDQSTKNFAKAQLILMLIALVLFIAFIALGVFSLNQYSHS